MHRPIRLLGPAPGPLARLSIGAHCLGVAQVQAKEDAPPKPVPVIAAPVRSAPFADRIEALGTLKTNESVALTVNVTGTVRAMRFDDGQRVRRGDVLVEMTDAEEQALVEEGQARVAEAVRQYDRVKWLAGQRSAAESL